MSLAKRFVWGARSRRELRMVSCHSFHIYGTWKNKEVVGGRFSSRHMGKGGKPQREDHFYRTPLDAINMLFGVVEYLFQRKYCIM